MNKEIVVKEDQLPTELLDEITASAGEGTSFDSSEMQIPFIRIIQAMSPQANKKDDAYIEGSGQGDAFNTVTNELYDSIDVIPCHYKRQYIEWADRGTSTGAPVAIHEADSDIVSQTTRGKDYKDRLPNGNYLDNTANHFVLVVGKNPETALISMKSTQLKVSRKWNSMMMGLKMQGKNGMFTPPTYSHIYKLKTVQQSNDKGTWFGWDVSRVGPIEDAGIYKIAKDFGANVSKGEVNVKHGEQESKSDSPY